MIIGHERIRSMLNRAIDGGHLPHALLFWGAHGIGKFAVALDLIRRLNCDCPEDGKPCGTCRNCIRIEDPFPFHPDVKILRDLTAPVFLNPERVFQRYCLENGVPGRPLSESERTDIAGAMERMVEQNIVIRSHTCTQAYPPLNIFHLSTEKLVTQPFIEQSASTPLTHWLLTKFKIYQESGCYIRTIKIEAIRDIQKMLYLHSFEGRYKAVVIDDADKMLPPAQNCLLKILEEPPDNSILILVVTHPKGLLPTIRSRCQIVPFYRLSEKELSDGLIRFYGWNPESAAESAAYVKGSLSEILGTDWEFEKRTEEAVSGLFEAGSRSDADWVPQFAETVTSLDPAGETGGLNRVVRWLHNRVCLHPDQVLLPGNLPRNRPFTVDAALSILDGINNIIAQNVYHTDVRLQLESMLFQLLEEMD